MARRELLFVHAFLALQLVVPLGYYASGDRLDERFAWRMFSAERMARCEVAMQIADQPVPLAARFHEAWINLAQRGRRPVIEAMAASLCRDKPGAAVKVAVSCKTMSGPLVLSRGNWDLCKTGSL